MKEGSWSLVAITPSRLSVSPFMGARKSDQIYLISRGHITSTFSEPHAELRGWLPEAPSFLGSSASFFE